MATTKTKASFIEPMLLLRSESLPEGPKWQLELKLDGYRALAIKTGGKIQLRSRNNNDFSGRYPSIVKALSAIPDETVVDGEIVALDDSGRPSFNMLQNYGSSSAPIYFYAFDLLILSGRDVMHEPLESRRKLLEQKVLSKLREPIRQSPVLEGSISKLVDSVRDQNLEGLIAKRRDSIYEPGQRSGVWRKMRVNQAGTRDWRLHSECKELRCADTRILRGRSSTLRCKDPKRIYASFAGAVVCEIAEAGDLAVSFCEPS